MHYRGCKNAAHNIYTNQGNQNEPNSNETSADESQISATMPSKRHVGVTR
jgi:hypothetical protein